MVFTGIVPVRVADPVIGYESVRNDVFVVVLVFFGIAVVVTGSLEADDAAVFHLAQRERTVRADGRRLHRPLVAVSRDDVLAERDERDRRAVAEEAVEIDVGISERDLEGVRVDSGYAEVVDGDARVAALDLARVFKVVKKGRRLAGIVGIEDPLPRVDEVDRLDRPRVRPFRLVEGYEDGVAVSVVRPDLVILHQRLRPLAVRVKSGQPLEKERHDLEHVLVGHGDLRIEVVNLLREVHFDHSAPVVGAVLKLLERGAPRKDSREHQGG